MKYLLLLAVIALVLWAMRRAALPPPPPPPPPPRQPETPKLEAMVRCSHCGLHLPSSEAVMDWDGRPYCCAMHRAAGPGKT
jgi:uncharacterized protein